MVYIIQKQKIGSKVTKHGLHMTKTVIRYSFKTVCIVQKQNPKNGFHLSITNGYNFQKSENGWQWVKF